MGIFQVSVSGHVCETKMSTAPRPHSALCGFGKLHRITATPRGIRKF